MQINARNSDVFFRWWIVTPNQCLRMVPVFAFLIRRVGAETGHYDTTPCSSALFAGMYCELCGKNMIWFISASIDIWSLGGMGNELASCINLSPLYIFWIYICLSIQVPGAIIIATKIIQCCRWFSKIEVVLRQLHPGWQLIYWDCLFLHVSQLRLC